MKRIALNTPSIVLLTATVLNLSACNLDQDSKEIENNNKSSNTQVINSIDEALNAIIIQKQLTGNILADRYIPNIDSPKSQLGMRLFFSKSLSGNRDTACVTCHHPRLGGGDNLSLPIGVEAEIPDLLGEGRIHSSAGVHYDGGPTVPRNAPTTFNIAGWNHVLFHDGRTENLGITEGIRTPDTAFNFSDPLSGNNLVSAQARFPITSPEEMKGFNHNDKNNQQIRTFLAERLGGYGAGAGELLDSNYWLTQFRTVFNRPGASAEELITEQNIAELIGDYERSQAFTNTPWREYIEGNQYAISDEAKQGALLFFRNKEQGGANCAACHSGDLFSDESFHNIAMPQIGRGKGDGIDGSGDLGRFRETGIESDKYAFRTPTLLNVEVTKPWSHAGAYTSLKAVVKHHLNPEMALSNYDFNQLSQVGIQNLDKLSSNSQKALDKLKMERAINKDVIADIDLNEGQVDQILAFLLTLTDPCVKDRNCLSQWIPEPNQDPNGDQLNAVNASGETL